MSTVLKLGGELLEDAAAVRSAAEAIVRLAASGPLVVVHGGGRAIDAELRARGESPRFVDGLRITDAAALDTVVSVLAGRTNTAFVAAIGAAGGRAVGLTGADGRIGLSRRAAPLRTVAGELVDLGLVGEPNGTDASLLRDLLGIGYIPVVASIGVDANGVLLNVNADVLAAHLAAILPAKRLIIAGGTAGVLDADGKTVPELPVDAIDAMMASGVAHSGMVAKLGACRLAFTSGVTDISIVAGRGVCRFHGRRRYSDRISRGDEGMTTATTNVMALETEHVLQVYKRNPVVFERGRGCRLFDADGRSYLDLVSGVGVAALGHANPRLAAAIAEQAATLLHTSNLYFHPLQGEVATRLSDMSGLPRAFFCNSGAEAVEACLKFARRYWFARERAASGTRRLRSLVPRPDDGRPVGDLGRALPRAVCAAAPGRAVRVAERPGRAPGRGHRIDRRRSSSSRCRAKAASGRSASAWRMRSRKPAAARARCSSPTRSSAGSAAPAGRSTRRRSGSSRI